MCTSSTKKQKKLLQNSQNIRQAGPFTGIRSVFYDKNIVLWISLAGQENFCHFDTRYSALKIRQVRDIFLQDLRVIVRDECFREV